MDLRRIVGPVIQGKLPPLGEFPVPLMKGVAAAASLQGKVIPHFSTERVITTLFHKEPDRVPVTTIMCSAARQILGISFPEFSQNAEKAADVFMAGFDFVGGDVIVLLWDLSVEAGDFGQELVFPQDSTPRPNYDKPVIRGIEDYYMVRPIPYAQSVRMKEFVRLCEIMAKRVGFRAIVAGFVFGPLGVLSMMRGAEQMFKDCVTNPKAVMHACDAITETLLEFVQAQCDTGVPAVVIDTLFASWNGLSKELWEQIEGPFSREISNLIKKNGLVVGIHNCGHGIYFDSQIKYMEPDVISFAHLPDDCATPREMKKRYGDQTTLVGYIETPLLINGTPQEIMEASRRQIEDLAEGGGFILAPGCEYPPNIPLTSGFALVEAAKRYS